MQGGNKSNLLTNPIKRFTIMGERCSGTNYIDKLFSTNILNLDITWDYGWKHWLGFYDFQNNEVENETLFIGIIRDPIEWIDSLYRMKHHIPPENHNIDNFLFNEWWSEDDNDNGNEINVWKIYRDRNYITGDRFKNIFELRKLKNDYLQNIMPNKVNNYLLINYNDFMLNPDKNFKSICNNYSLKLDENFENLVNLYAKKNIELDNYYIDKIKENLDLEQELSLNFDLTTL